MTTDQFASLLRSVLKMAGAALVTKGIADSTTAEAVIGAIVALGGLFWSHFAHLDDSTTTPPPPTTTTT